MLMNVAGKNTLQFLTRCTRHEIAHAASSLASYIHSQSAANDVRLRRIFGYLKLMETSYDRNVLLKDIGKVWRITEVAHKPFPSGRATHGVIDALRGLAIKHSLKVRSQN